MSENYKVAVIVGSLRKDGFTIRTAKAMMSLAPAVLRFEVVPIGELPLYNQDNDSAPPAAWVEFRDRVRSSEALLFVTPEYNRSVPGVLKNAIDVGSRPYGHSVWKGRPAGVVSVSPGGIGGFGANHHLRQSLVFLNVPVMQQPEAYVGGAASLFEDDGSVKAEETRAFLEQFMISFADWIATIIAPSTTGR